MLVSLIIVFREAMEAGLVAGIILAATRGVPHRGRWVAGGVVVGIAGAMLVAIFAAALADAFEGTGQEVFSAAILGFAVVMLAWHVGWMARHGAEMAARMHAAGEAVRLGRKSLAALAAVVAIAVLREGAEVVLFLMGIAAGSNAGASAMAAGGLAGLALACALSWLVYRGLVIIPMHRMFSVTNFLIALLAAGMAGQAVATLHGADLLPAWGERLWDTSAVLGDDTLLGRALRALAGYSAKPSGIQVAAWAATLAMLLLLNRFAGRRVSREPRARGSKLAAAIVASSCVIGTAAPARAGDISVNLELRDHRFVPDRLEVPANVKFRLLVKNNDNTADEFESVDLNREKLVSPGQTVTVFLGPLPPGTYKIFGDFHQDTARGVIIAK